MVQGGAKLHLTFAHRATPVESNMPKITEKNGRWWIEGNVNGFRSKADAERHAKVTKAKKGKGK